MEQLETIHPLTLAPWEERVEAITDETAEREVDVGWAVRVAVSSSARNGVVGVGGAVEMSASVPGGSKLETFSFTRRENRTERLQRRACSNGVCFETNRPQASISQHRTNHEQ